ncbi:uncharacterized protein LOC122803146 [Protopterus annectens]|uniref:uncharacterized protein LOC122803146 n=1 Tax=Protopterus annectens TaxID=7888 RepID=UPI001CF979D7|nr:uncharacterized protein LOC122803146 [Protopterus annectens]
MKILSPKIVFLMLLLMSDLLCKQIEILEGGNISLKPDWKENVNNVKEITWTLNSNKVAEWNINGKVTFFNQFKDRTQLNTETGEMNIFGVQLKDGGTYRCELIDDNGVIFPREIAVHVHSRLGAPKITCIPNDTAVMLLCNASSSEPIIYNWNFQPCTANSDDCELENNNQTITIRNANSHISHQVYCTINNSLHSNRSESVLIRNCIKPGE